MHVTTKDTDANGKHILTSVIEGDGAVELASEKAELYAEIVSVQRTASGGIQVQTAVTIKEPAAIVSVSSLTPEQQATAYFVSKGLSESDAAAKVAQFGASRVLAAKAKEEADKGSALDKELADFLASDQPAAKPSGSVN